MSAANPAELPYVRVTVLMFVTAARLVLLKFNTHLVKNVWTFHTALLPCCQLERRTSTSA